MLPQENGTQYSGKPIVDSSLKKNSIDSYLEKRSSKDCTNCLKLSPDTNKYTSPTASSQTNSTDSTLQTERHVITKLVTVTSGAQNNFFAKVIFFISLILILALVHCLTAQQFILPYFYVISAPVLIVIRYVMYWKNKWQYFLFDFCYFSNFFLFIYLWAFPSSHHAFAVVFGIASGPMLWAVMLFRNSLVLHSVDKMTSSYIHLLPAFLAFCIRWYPESTSQYWYTDFVPVFDLADKQLLIWLFAIPLGAVYIHSILHTIIVHVIIKPGKEYLNSFSFLSEKSTFSKLINVCGVKYQFLMYHVFYWLYGLLGTALAILFYHYYLVHLICLILMCCVAAWNGASFYVDVFSVRGFNTD